MTERWIFLENIVINHSDEFLFCCASQIKVVCQDHNQISRKVTTFKRKSFLLFCVPETFDSKMSWLWLDTCIKKLLCTSTSDYNSKRIVTISLFRTHSPIHTRRLFSFDHEINFQIVAVVQNMNLHKYCFIHLLDSWLTSSLVDRIFYEPSQAEIVISI